MSIQPRIREAIDDLNYTPNKLAQNLRQRSTSTIAAVVPDSSNFFFTQAIRGIQDVARDYNMNLVLCNTDGSVDRDVEYFDFLAGTSEGLILAPNIEVGDRYRTRAMQIGE